MIVNAAGRSIGYDDVGSGLPVVFIHGFPHDRSLWTSQLGALAAPVRTLACDLRGFGDSPGIATSVDEYADDVIAWLHALGIPSAVVVGLSMGGYVAFAMWRKKPALIRALVLAHTRASPDDDTARARRTQQMAYVEENGSGALADQLVQSMIGKTTREERPEIRDRVHALLTRAPVRGIVGALTAMRDRPDSTSTLPTIDVPTLIIAGDQDAIISSSETRAMHAAIAGSRLEVVNGVGHLSCLEKPAAFNHLVSEFLAELSYS
ncbi:MAG TPA: alpha/beta hydrolase [Gemmatimonadaceae bacterium]|nr:alpha/beta hydrolase [Gemmatimonadaceae bacterium]